jgi:hypothetical protein
MGRSPRRRSEIEKWSAVDLGRDDEVAVVTGAAGAESVIDSGLVQTL